MAGLRILYVIRPDAVQRTGGDAVQAIQTAQALRAMGHTVDIAASAQPDARGYDIAHVFGVFDPLLARAQIDACRRSATPLALSPIWWDLTEFYARSAAVEKALALREGAVEKRLARIRERCPRELTRARARRAAAERKAAQRELMELAGVLLPNSTAEAYRYVVDLDLHHPRVHVVPNAVDAAAVEDALPAHPRKGVLCVGRVESRKNQAMMLYALREDDVAITLAGECYDGYYRRLCERWNKCVTFTGPLDRAQVFALMRRSLVHALPAWLETPGIASLEAAAAGCAIVAGNRASEFEYFGGDAAYCDPGSAQSIRAAVLGAIGCARGGARETMRERLRTLTWRHAAQATLEGYALLR
ncbi:MAG: glycosyltransferase [Candidatus Baltobacteraceae bacterium]